MSFSLESAYSSPINSAVYKAQSYNASILPQPSKKQTLAMLAGYNNREYEFFSVFKKLINTIFLGGFFIVYYYIFTITCKVNGNSCDYRLLFIHIILFVGCIYIIYKLF